MESKWVDSGLNASSVDLQPMVVIERKMWGMSWNEDGCPFLYRTRAMEGSGRGKSWSQRKRYGQSSNQGNELRLIKKKRIQCYLRIFRDIFQICPRVPGRDFNALPSEEDTIYFLRDLGHTGVINSLNDVVVDQMHQPKFKKASLSKKESELVPGDEEPVKKGKRLKTPAKKSASKPATGIVIREPPVETKSKRKEKEKVDVAHGKGIELLSEVALSEKAQMKEARMKSLRDFHKTHPSGSGTVAEKPPSVEKITPTVTSEGTGDKPGVPSTNDDSSESESESWGNDEDDSNNEQESSDESSKQENESEEQELDSEQDEESDDDDQEQEDFDQENESEDDEMKSDEEQGMDDTTDQFDDDADARLEEPTETATGIVSKKTEVPVTSSSRSSDLASKFLNFLDIPQTDAEIVSPLDVHVHHEVPRTQALHSPYNKPVSSLSPASSTEVLLGPAFRLLKGTHSSYAELEYDFEECYKALLEKLDWENPEGAAPATDMIFHALKTDNGFQTIWSPVKVAYGQSMRYGGISHRRGTTLLSRIEYLNQEYRHGVLAKDKMEHIGKEKSSFHDQGHQQAAKGKKDDEKFREIRWFNTTAGNPVKRILLKLNLSDHRSILTDSKDQIKMEMERRSVKVKELRERCIIKVFKLKNQEKYEHVGPKITSFTRWQRLQDGEKRLCLVDDLKVLKYHILLFKLKSKECAPA
ncbi:hypothetical protein Tco_0971014 [Tanacetum coccineum]